MSVSLIQTVLCLPVETEKEGDEGYCFGLAARSLCSKYVEHHTKKSNKINTQSLCFTILECGSTPLSLDFLVSFTRKPAEEVLKCINPEFACLVGV